MTSRPTRCRCPGARRRWPAATGRWPSCRSRRRRASWVRSAFMRARPTCSTPRKCGSSTSLPPTSRSPWRSMPATPSGSRPNSVSARWWRTSARCSGSPTASSTQMLYVSPAYETVWGPGRRACTSRPGGGSTASRRRARPDRRCWRSPSCSAATSTKATASSDPMVAHAGYEPARFPSAMPRATSSGSSASRPTSPSAPARGAVPPGAEDGGGRPAGRRHRPRLQQPAHRHHRLQRAGCCRDWLARRPGARRPRADPAAPASAPRPLTRQLLAFSRQQVLQPRGARPERRVVADMREACSPRLIGEDIELVSTRLDPACGP